MSDEPEEMTEEEAQELQDTIDEIAAGILAGIRPLLDAIRKQDEIAEE